MNYSAKQILEILNPVNNNIHDLTIEITNIIYDSRKIIDTANALFLCIKTENNDGHLFIEQAYQKGVRNFIIENKSYLNAFTDANFFLVENTITAIQKLAAFHRKQFTGPMIAITGSNGKTIVKEWLYQLLKTDFNIYRSPRSFNSQLGVALSLLGIESWHNLAIIEVGISKHGEMQALENMVKPNLGIVTNIGSAHDQGFENLNQKTVEKLSLLKNTDVAILPADNELINLEKTNLQKHNSLIQFITWGKNEKAKYKIASIVSENNQTEIELNYRSQPIKYRLPFTDEASIQNSLTCICVLHSLERLDPEHLEKFSTLQSLANRLTFTTGINGNFIVDDSYSNDPESLQIALDFCLRQQPVMKHYVVLSDFEQSNSNKQLLYKKINNLLVSNSIDGLIIVGKEIVENVAEFTTPILGKYENTEQLIQHLPELNLNNATILIKGARSYGLERVKQKLEQKEHETVLEINLDALKHNFLYFKSLLKSGTKIMPMVKAFGYGSGTFEAAKLLESLGCNYFSVAYLDEGILLRNAGIKVPIMVLNSNISQLASLLEYDLEPVIYSKEQYYQINKLALEKNLSAHIELDTGMHRLGFDCKDILEIINSEKPNFNLVSIFSHLSASENPEFDAFTLKQIQLFKNTAEQIELLINKNCIKHIANTGGILRFSEAHFDMVRLGIGLYGVDPGEQLTSDLQAVTTLKTVISQIKTIEAGESVGYSRKALSNHERRIAILPIGYADGLWRALGNERGEVFINGSRVPIVGNICMDMCMVEIGDLKCNVGDEVEIFGEHISVYEVAAICNTIPYETLTGISQRVKRVFVSY